MPNTVQSSEEALTIEQIMTIQRGGPFHAWHAWFASNPNVVIPGPTEATASALLMWWYGLLTTEEGVRLVQGTQLIALP